VASHELKTPLTSLQLQLQWMQRQAKGAPPEALAQTFDLMHRQIGRVTTLINSLLEISRISTGRLDLVRQEGDLGQIARATIGRFTDQASSGMPSIALEASGDLRGAWDAPRIDLILGNHLTNALKFGEGKPVRVRVEDRGEAVELGVHDEGIGIAPADQARIFDRFERAVSWRQYSGFGVGLWLVRKVAEAHGGSVRVESEVGRGATFVVSLPKQG
jgi:signal transduction histidine kinase